MLHASLEKKRIVGAETGQYDTFRSWSLNGIYASLVHHPPATLSARSASGCVVHGLDFFSTTSRTRDDETHRVDDSVHDHRSV